MESVKSVSDGEVDLSSATADPPANDPPGIVARLLSWRSSPDAGALDRDPTLWMHRDVTA